MGHDKATLRWRGRPLWEWQIDTLRGLHPEKILLSARSDVSWRPADVGLILDAAPSRGPVSGLAAALIASDSDHLFALAIDMPFMTSEHLRFLGSLAASGKGVIPMIEGNAEPLGAIYPKEARPIFREALESDNYSLQPIVRQLVATGILTATPISDSDRQFYRNINEPHDIA
jgi:molybdopterin-guanine dinucleotide biosynthesis protein A